MGFEDDLNNIFNPARNGVGSFFQNDVASFFKNDVGSFFKNDVLGFLKNDLGPIAKDILHTFSSSLMAPTKFITQMFTSLGQGASNILSGNGIYIIVAIVVVGGGVAYYITRPK